MAPKRKATNSVGVVPGKRLATSSSPSKSPGKARSVKDLFQFRSLSGTSSDPNRLKPKKHSSSSSLVASEPQDDLTPWTERYKPTSRAEVAVHKKKLEVRLSRALGAGHVKAVPAVFDLQTSGRFW